MRQPAPYEPEPGGGGWGAERPVNMLRTATLSSPPRITDSPPIVDGSPPSRQWSARDPFARNYTHPS